MKKNKLTLSADPELVQLARRIAAERRTSISALFDRLFRAMDRAARANGSELGPLTRKVSGIVQLPPGKSDRTLLEEALADRFELLP
jgi:hypothetical protein